MQSDREQKIEEYCYKMVLDFMVNYEETFNEPMSESSVKKKVEIAAESAINDCGGIYPPGKEELIKRVVTQLEIDKSITYGETSVLADSEADHQEWLTEEYIQSMKWPRWQMFRKYLRSQGAILAQLRELSKSTTEILRNMENPNRPAPWDNRGLVVGNIQAGKTTNYIGVLAKAVDAGYKVIIVLAGTTNDLRSQTQKRIDEGLLGYDSLKRSAPVKNSTKHGRTINTATNSGLDGDYGKGSFGVNFRLDGEDAVLYVVKKNVSILRNIYLDLQNNVDIHGKISAPLVMIDDEADNASVNGKQQAYDLSTGKRVSEEEVDPAKVNMYIRAILSCFSRSSYIAYTATPYANIFIMPSNEDEKNKKVFDEKLNREVFVGEDLFPRNFIVQLSPGSNYFGPEQVFGLGEGGVELPVLVRTSQFEDEDTILKTSGKTRKWIGTEMPESMKYAISCFILSVAGKRFRKIRNKHNTMLIHVDRLTKVQAEITKWVTDYVDEIKDIFTIETRSQQIKFLTSLKTVWDAEYVPKFETIHKMTEDNSLSKIEWGNIEPLIPNVIHDIVCLEINSARGKKGFEYDKYPDGRTIIAIGGDKLARGLTLEGLTISYFLRHSRMYDSLLQMGRWFGYRAGYIDLSRIFASSTLINNYREIAKANSDLAEQFRELASLQPARTPKDFGLMVMSDATSQLMVTALNKSRNTVKRVLTFSGKPSAVTYLTDKKNKNESNLNIIRNFLGQLGQYQKKGSTFIWKGVPAETIISEFLDKKFYTDLHNSIYTDESLIKYIEKMNKSNEIVNWTVALFQGEETDGNLFHLIDGIDMRLSVRSVYLGDGYYELNQRRLPSGADEAIDLDDTQYEEALSITNEERKRIGKGATKNPSPSSIRRVRPSTNGLLMLYILKLKRKDTDEGIEGIFPSFMISFSNSSQPTEDTVIEYQLNSVAERAFREKFE